MENYIIEKDGRKRQASQITCDACSVVFLKRTSFLKNKNFCSRECSSKERQNRTNKNCAYCNKQFELQISKTNSKSGLYFCSRKCKDNAQRIESGFSQLHPSHYTNGYSEYRDLAFRNYEHKCSACSYDKYPILLEVHHIDSDRKNAELSNLIILCPTCHTALTLKRAVMHSDRIWRWIVD